MLGLTWSHTYIIHEFYFTYSYLIYLLISLYFLSFFIFLFLCFSLKDQMINAKSHITSCVLPKNKISVLPTEPEAGIGSNHPPYY